MGKLLYIKVSNDELELPLYVADSAQEMAEHEGKTTNNIQSQISKYEHGRHAFSQYRRVLVEE